MSDKRTLHNGIRSGLLVLALVTVVLSVSTSAQRFYPDDPLAEEPPPFPTLSPEPRALNEIVDLLENTFRVPGEKHPEDGLIPSGGINTMGEVLNGPWYDNRSLKNGSGPRKIVSPSGPGGWKVLSLKGLGNRPGLLITDTRRWAFWLHFDPIGQLEMDTGAAMVASRAFDEFGYHTPDTSIVYFQKEDLSPDPRGKQITSLGRSRKLTQESIENFLDDLPFDPEKGYRALATRVPDRRERRLGPFRMEGVRSDDPNDIVPHEHRRDLRGLYVLTSWLNLTRIRPTSTLDVLVEEESGVPMIRHYFVDFSGALGSGGDHPKRAESGHEPYFDRNSAVKNTLGAGLYVPEWMSARYPKLPSAGHFDYETFKPDDWKPLHRLAPFENRLPDDEFWAARRIMAFSDEDIRRLVEAGRYSNPAAVDWLVRCLVERRNRIGREYFAKVLPLVDIKLSADSLTFDDLEVRYGFLPNRDYRIQWAIFENSTERSTPVGLAGSLFQLPAVQHQMASGSYLSARIVAEQEEKAVTVYLRKEGTDFRIVGVERDWPGKLLVRTQSEVETSFPGYVDLDQQQRRLLLDLSREAASETGRILKPSEYFGRLTLSQRSTFDAITHALMNSPLTDARGRELGKAIDLVESLERVVGEGKGKRRDLQFRIYGYLSPGAVEKLEQSREFYRDHDNTSHHPGYPISFRQGDNLPSLQFSISRDGKRVDIDVDYRSGGWPAAALNGHFKVGNSDVRAGDNIKRHNRRWAGLIAWWDGKHLTTPAKQRQVEVASGRPGVESVDSPAPTRAAGQRR